MALFFSATSAISLSSVDTTIFSNRLLFFNALIVYSIIGIPQNLVPYLTQTVIGKLPVLKVFGSNYDTPDGTCIRDYIHVMDLAQAHIDSLYYLMSSKKKMPPYEIFNVGTGKGLSVLEVIKLFEKTTGKKVNYEFDNPRDGDTVAAYADVSKIKQKIGWKAQYSIQNALQTAWEWEKEILDKS